ncbi:hypothetical protein L6452_17886 [Arctium lappa]|uniref:Uncharacterized protein n=1 Tax=Arctium lappa TaxID=4217 RepID=A0ACB9C4N8_ARCLA|nr:hypothetical protein L6452_17886 [Arctium lappa]
MVLLLLRIHGGLITAIIVAINLNGFSQLYQFEKKVKKMLSLIEEDGDSFEKRAEMFYENRPSIIASAEDLHGSYRSLAEKYNQLVVGYVNVCDHGHDSGLEFMRRLSLESQAEKLKKMKHGVLRVDDDFENGWNKLRLTVMKLVQDRLEQKVELVKRNNENREAIDDLRAYIRKLLVKNIELKSKLAHTKGDIKRDESQLSRAEDVILKEILP